MCACHETNPAASEHNSGKRPKSDASVSSCEEACPFAPFAQDDQNDCTTDTCDCSTGEVGHDAVADGATCRNHKSCQQGLCTRGSCQTDGPDIIDDGDACTVDVCGPNNGEVAHNRFPAELRCTGSFPPSCQVDPTMDLRLVSSGFAECAQSYRRAVVGDTPRPPTAFDSQTLYTCVDNLFCEPVASTESNLSRAVHSDQLLRSGSCWDQLIRDNDACEMTLHSRQRACEGVAATGAVGAAAKPSKITVKGGIVALYALRMCLLLAGWDAVECFGSAWTNYRKCIKDNGVAEYGTTSCTTGFPCKGTPCCTVTSMFCDGSGPSGRSLCVYEGCASDQNGTACGTFCKAQDDRTTSCK
jgi:hypothetical protein